MIDLKDLDAIDLRLLRALQANGRATYDELSSLVALSPSAALRRVKRLEEEGFIAGYAAQLNPAQLGLTLTAYINVRLGKQPDRAARAPAEAFSASVQSWPEVVDCVALSGEMDYLMRVVVSDMAHYSRFVMDSLLRHPSVLDCKSSFVLNQVKATTALPI